MWIGTHASLGGELAIKFLTRDPSHEGEDEATAMARFQFEAQVAAKLARRTRHIVSVTDHGEEHDRAYLVMELVNGESLEAMMRREGRCSLKSIAPLVAQVAKGLTAAHGEGVFHRDLKPANILLSRDEDGGLLVKILDFGIAKTVRSHKVSGALALEADPFRKESPGHETEIGIVLGTPNYISPEQARGLPTLDHRCDLWALATIAFECLTGTLPYDGETTADLLVNICSSEPMPVRKHRPDVPESADAFFAKAFAANVNRRFADATSLAAAFAAVAADGERRAEITLPHVDLASQAPQTTDREVQRVLAAPRIDSRMIESDAATSDTGAHEPERRRTGAIIAVFAVLLLSVAVIGVRLFSTPTPTPTPAPSAEPVTTAPVVLPEPPTTPSPVTSSAAPEQPAVAVKPQSGAKILTPMKPSPVASPAPSPSPTPKKPLDKGEIL